jgi:cobalt-zinc-cadmium efflux system outer membrane protein
MRRLTVALLTGLAASVLLPARTPGQPAPRVTNVHVSVTPDCGVDLASLCRLALANNPELREAAAEVEEARGRRTQAAKIPNPSITYNEYSLGSRDSPFGSISLEMNQEIPTAGKRRLDMAVASQGTRIACTALAGKRFEVLTAVRRAYYDFLAANESVVVLGENVATLQESVRLTRKLVEEPKTLPRADLLRAEGMLAQGRILRERAEVARASAWRQLAAAVGVPGLPPPAAAPDLPAWVPDWDEQAVLQRVLAVHTDLREAAQEAERARLEWQRARAEAVPNVQVGGGYIRDFVLEGASGGIVSVGTSLPVWDRQRGEIYAAQARWARAEAARQTTANRLSRETAEAFGRYLGARRQVERLTREALPALEESLRQIAATYEAGKNPEGFVDVQTATETLNEARTTRAEARRALWEAVADLQGLMQFGPGEDRCP